MICVLFWSFDSFSLSISFMIFFLISLLLITLERRRSGEQRMNGWVWVELEKSIRIIQSSRLLSLFICVKWMWNARERVYMFVIVAIAVAVVGSVATSHTLYIFFISCRCSNTSEHTVHTHTHSQLIADAFICNCLCNQLLIY